MREWRSDPIKPQEVTSKGKRWSNKRKERKDVVVVVVVVVVRREFDSWADWTDRAAPVERSGAESGRAERRHSSETSGSERAETEGKTHERFVR
jgi:hypothetical protein